MEEGDTLSDIAREYTGDNTHYQELAAYNCLEDTDWLEIGQTLMIPADWLAAMP